MNIVNINYSQNHPQFDYDMVPFLLSIKIYYKYLKPISVAVLSTAAGLLGLWFQIPPGTWINISCHCGVFRGRGLCDGANPSSREDGPSVACLSVIEEPERRPRPTRVVSHYKKKKLLKCEN
jgi:hypothetical protein